MARNKSGNHVPLRPPVQILIAEDDRTDAELVTATLVKAGYRLTFDIADTPGEFRRRLRERDYDIILADFNLRSWTAIDALEILSETGKDIPLIVVTGSLGDEAAVDCIKRGAADYVLKNRLNRLPGVFGRALREKAQREQAARLQEQIWRAKHDWELTFDAVSDPLLILDKDCRIQRANRAAASLMGLPFQDLIGRFCYEVLHGSAEPRLDCPHQKLTLSGRDERGEMEEPRLGKTFEAAASPLRDESGTFRGCVQVLRDITERKRAERERARLASAVEQAAEAVLITDPEGAMVYVNPAFERITGYNRKEVLGQNPRLLKSGKQDAEFYNAMWSTLTRGEQWSGHFSNKRKDGSTYEGETAISPVRDETGALLNYVAVQRDVTRERKLEAQLRQARKMEAVERLAGGIAHNFNNLLVAITGYSDLLLSKTADERQRRHVEGIKKASERASSLTRQLLALGQRQELAPQVLDLNGSISRMNDVLRRALGEGVELEFCPGPELGRAMADPAQVEQIVLDLALYAREAMSKGGRLVIETANVELSEHHPLAHDAFTPGRYVLLAITDAAGGMDEEALSHVFEPFYSHSGQGKGSDLGLAVVYGIVKQSGGLIEVSSEKGQGTRFEIYLPRTDVPLPAQTLERVGADLPRGNETILLVDDEGAFRALVRETLQDCGYAVLEASGAFQALSILERYVQPIDLLLTDVVMPRLSGRDLTDRLEPWHPEAKVLFMSGYDDHRVPLRGVRGLGMPYLRKPFTAQALASTVREVLDAASAPRH